jgi:SPP1 gp7 family putative phage head morphogenesis protein
MALQDQRIVDHLASSQGFFVTNQYIERAEFFSARARNIVAEGLSQGLGQDEIARMLRAEIGNALGPARSGRYWNLIANVFVNRARTYGQLASYSEAGIERYRFEAILDERTTEQCRMLHGREWEVRRGLQQHIDVAGSPDPQAVKDIMPWFRTGRDENGDRVIFSQNQAGERTIMARILEPGIGVRDRIGRYETTRALNEISAVQPPLHGLCRSTIVASL